MLTFEYDNQQEKIDIHTDLVGLKSFRDVIDSLIHQVEKVGHEHIHLMTEDWGGPDSGLTNEKQNPDCDLINHVKIYCWHEKSKL